MKAALEQVQRLLDQETPDTEEAIKLLDSLTEEETKHWLVDYFHGIALMQKVNYKDAMAHFKESIIKHPENPHSYLMVAKCFHALSDLKQAERYGKAAIQLDKRLLEGWMFMGEMYWTQSSLNKAIQCFTISNKLDPKNVEIAFKLAQLYKEKGDLKMALELFDVTLHMKPDLIEARIGKDEIYQEFGKKGRDKHSKYIHLCFNHLYAKSLSDMLGYVNENNDQQHLLFVEAHWAIDEYKPDFNQDEHTLWFNHKYDLQAIIDRCLGSDVDGIFVHGLFFSWQKQLILEIGSRKHIGWIIWGGDLYNRLKVKEPIIDIVKHIDSIHSLVEGDVSMFNNHYGKRATFRFGYPYPGLYGEIPDLKEQESRPIIIVGNSGDYSNNHVEILEALRTKKDLKNYTILLPVSYNLIPEYERAIKDWVKAAGMSNQVTLIKNFIEPDKYREFINDSCMLITAHNRQQAIGNMLLSLYSGNTTILKQKIVVHDEEHINPTWEMLQNHGLSIRSFEEFKNAGSIQAFLNRSKEVINKNRQIIINEFGMQKRAEDLVSSCNQISERRKEKAAVN